MTTVLEEEIAQFLDALGLANYQPSDVTGDTFLNRLPDQPDLALAVARYGGTESDAHLGYDEPSIQVRVRGPNTDPRVAAAKAQEIYNALHGITDRTMPAGTWLSSCIGSQGGPIYIGPDQLGRHEYTVNFRMHIRNTAGVRE